MKKIGLGQTITIIANIGVIAGIAFLALELQQNNRLLTAEAEYNLMQNRMANSVADDPETAAFWFKVNSGVPLTDVERFRVDAAVNNTIVNWEWEYGQVQAGNLSFESLPVSAYRAAFHGQGWQRKMDYAPLWDRLQSQLDPEFVTFMREYVIDPGPPN